MVHFPGFARTRLWIQRAVAEVRSAGFPHSEISGSKPVCGSPKLIAANHVLLRLLAPRHPPYALSSLTTNSRAAPGPARRAGKERRNRVCHALFGAPHRARLPPRSRGTGSRSPARPPRIELGFLPNHLHSFGCQTAFPGSPGGQGETPCVSRLRLREAFLCAAAARRARPSSPRRAGGDGGPG